jgi:hypothetical protein
MAPKSPLLKGTEESERLVRTHADALRIVEATERLVATGDDQTVVIRGQTYVVRKLELKR